MRYFYFFKIFVWVRLLAKGMKGKILKNKRLCIGGLFIMILMSTLQIIIPLSMKEMITAIEKKESYKVFFACISLYALLWFVYNLINVRW